MVPAAPAQAGLARIVRNSTAAVRTCPVRRMRRDPDAESCRRAAVRTGMDRAHTRPVAPAHDRHRIGKTTRQPRCRRVHGMSDVSRRRRPASNGLRNTIVSSRSAPVVIIDTGAPATASTRAMKSCAARGSAARSRTLSRCRASRRTARTRASRATAHRGSPADDRPARHRSS